MDIILPRKTPKLKIVPSHTFDEVLLQCNFCKNINELKKKEVTPGLEFACWNCKKIFEIGVIPDDIKYWLQSKNEDINYRPRIIRN